MQSAAQSGDLASVDPRAVKRANSNYTKTRAKGIAQVAGQVDANQAAQRQQQAAGVEQRRMAAEAKRQQADADRQANQQATAQEAQRMIGVRAAAAQGAVTNTDIQTGKRTIATHPDGAPVYKAGPQGAPVQVPEQRDTTVPTGFLGATGETQPRQVPAWKQSVRDDRGNVSMVAPESVTNKAGEKIHTGSDPVTGQPVKTVVGVDTAVRDKAARLAKHEAESNALAMRENQMEQARLGFQPNWEATNDNFTKVQRDVKALEAKGIVRNPENGAFSRVDPKSGYHEDLTPFEAATHRKEAEDARLAYAAASKRHGELLPVAENFNRVKADIDAQKLKLAAQRLRIESDLPEDDGGVAEAMAKQAGLVEETPATAAAKQVEQAAMLPKPDSGTSATQPPATPEIQDAFKALSGLAGTTLAPQRNYTQIQRNGRWIASLDKDSDGSQSVTLRPEAAHDDDINRILTKAGTDGVPLYVKENPDRPRQAKETAWAAEVFGIHADEQLFDPDGKPVPMFFDLMTERGAMPEQIAAKVRDGTLSVQRGEAIMRNVWKDTLAAPDVEAPATFAKWIGDKTAAMHKDGQERFGNPAWRSDNTPANRWNDKSNLADRQRLRVEYLGDYLQANQGKPGVSRAKIQAMMAQDIGRGESAGTRVSSAARAGGRMLRDNVAGSMFGLAAGAVTSLGAAEAALFGSAAGAKEFSDGMKLRNRDTANWWDAVVRNAKSQFTDGGRALDNAFTDATNKLRHVIDEEHGKASPDPQRIQAAESEARAAALAFHHLNNDPAWPVTDDMLNADKDQSLGAALARYAATADPQQFELYRSRLLMDNGRRQQSADLEKKTYAASGFRGAVAGAMYAGWQEVGSELVADAAIIFTGGASKAAQLGLRAGGAVGKASRIAKLSERMAAGFERAGQFGVKAESLVNPLTAAQRVGNTAKKVVGTAIKGAVGEGAEELIPEAGADQPAPLMAFAMGAFGGLALTPIFHGGAALMESHREAGAEARTQGENVRFADRYNAAMDGTPGFATISPELAGTARQFVDETMFTGAVKLLANAAKVIADPAASENTKLFWRNQSDTLRADIAAQTEHAVAAAREVSAIADPAARSRMAAVVKVATGNTALLTPQERAAVSGAVTQAGAPYFIAEASPAGALVETLSPEARAEILTTSPAVGALLQTPKSAALIETQTAQANGQAPQAAGGAGAGGIPAVPAQGQAQAVMMEAGQYEAARQATPGMPDIPAAVAQAHAAGLPVSVSMAQASGHGMPGYERQGAVLVPTAKTAAGAVAERVKAKVEAAAPRLRGRVIVSPTNDGNPTGGASVGIDGSIQIHVSDVASEIAKHGEAATEAAVEQLVMRHEAVHVVQFEAVRAIWEAQRNPGSFDEFFQSWYGAMAGEVAPAFKVARDIYGAEAWDRIPTEANKAAELVRMLVEAKLDPAQTGQFSELFRAVKVSASPTLIETLRQAIEILTKLVTTGKLPAAAMEHVNAITDLYQELIGQKTKTHEPNPQGHAKSESKPQAQVPVPPVPTGQEGAASAGAAGGGAAAAGPAKAETETPVTSPGGFRIVQGTDGKARILRGEDVLSVGTPEAMAAELPKLEAAMSSPLVITGEAIKAALVKFPRLGGKYRAELEDSADDVVALLDAMPPEERAAVAEKAVADRINRIADAIAEKTPGKTRMEIIEGFRAVAGKRAAQQAASIEQAVIGTEAPQIPAGRSEERDTPGSEMRIKVTQTALDLDQLIGSSDPLFPGGALQPRNRSTQASKNQREEMVANLRDKPDQYRRYVEGVTTDAGRLVVAPLFAADGSQMTNEAGKPLFYVVSGNGRRNALEEARARKVDGHYQAAVRGFLESEKIGTAGMSLPVPVSVFVPQSAKEVIDLAEYSNRDAQLAVSNTEQANRDARSIEESNILKLWQPDASGDAAAASNRDFVKAFARAVGDAGILDNHGNLTDEGAKRIERAMVAALLGPDQAVVIDLLFNRAGPLGLRAVLGGVASETGALLKLAAAKPDFDLSPVLVNALRLAVEAKQAVVNGEIGDVSEFFDQGNLFESTEITPERQLARAIVESRSRKAVREILAAYRTAAEAVDTSTMSMFADDETTREDLILKALESRPIEQVIAEVEAEFGKGADLPAKLRAIAAGVKRLDAGLRRAFSVAIGAEASRLRDGVMSAAEWQRLNPDALTAKESLFQRFLDSWDASNIHQGFSKLLSPGVQSALGSSPSVTDFDNNPARYDDEIRTFLGATKVKIAAYEPAASVFSPFKGAWSFVTIQGNEHPAILQTKHEAIAMAERHLELKRSQYTNPSGYFDIVQVRAEKRLVLIRKHMDAGLSEMDAGARSRVEIPEPLKGLPEDRNGQLRLLSSPSIDPRIAEAFGDFEPDAYGLPPIPETLPDGHPLLVETKTKKTAVLPADHWLVAGVPSGIPLVKGLPESHPARVGGFLPAGEVSRKEFGRAVVRLFLTLGVEVPADAVPVVYATGGGGGAGKSTILKRLQADGIIDLTGAVTVNADEIKDFIPEFAQFKAAGDGRGSFFVHEESSQLAKNLMDALLKPENTRFNFVYDATLANKSKGLAMMQRWMDSGFVVHFIGVTIDPHEAMIRAVLRGKGSGRWVPSAALVAAHTGFNTAVLDYMEIADRANLFDNTPPSPTDVAKKTSADEKIFLVAPQYLDIIKSREKEITTQPAGQYETAFRSVAEIGDGGTKGRGRDSQSELGQGSSQARQSLGSSPSPSSQLDLFGGIEAQITGPRAAMKSRAVAAARSVPADSVARQNIAKSIGQREGLTALDLFAGSAAKALDKKPKRGESAPDDNDLFSGTRSPGNRKSDGNATAQPGGSGGLRGLAGGQGEDLFGFGSRQLQPGLGSGERSGDDGRGRGVRGDANPGDAERGATGESGDSSMGGNHSGNQSGSTGPDAGLINLGQAGVPDLVPVPEDEADRNARIDPTVILVPKGQGAKIAANFKVFGLLRQLTAEGRNPTPAEKAQLLTYSGWGHSKGGFDDAKAEAFELQSGGADKDNYINGLWKRDKAGFKRSYSTRPVDRLTGNEGPSLFDLYSWNETWGEVHRELKEKLSEAEYNAAKRSVLNAHYTTPAIIDAQWQMIERLGFKGGRALEPGAGIGHYIGTQPEHLAARTIWSAVELDQVTSQILALLYPQVRVNSVSSGAGREITGQGFEEALVADNSQDVVISNVPFHEVGPWQSKKQFKQALNLHNYFFARALQKVKPGGLVCFITSSSTMENNGDQRRFLASRGELISAVRLPNNAFKENAGTEVTTDIIILRKPDGRKIEGHAWTGSRMVGSDSVNLKRGDQTPIQFLKSFDTEGTWQDASLEAARAAWDKLRVDGLQIADSEKEAKKTNAAATTAAWKAYVAAFERAESQAIGLKLGAVLPVRVNEYFAANPQNAFGRHSLAGSMYRADEYTLQEDLAGGTLEERFAKVIEALPTDIMGQSAVVKLGTVKDIERTDKPFSFVERDGKFWQVQKNHLEPVTWSPAEITAFRSWSRVKEAVRNLIAAELDPKADAAEIAALREVLNREYGKHVGQFGPISKTGQGSKHDHLHEDPEFPLTAALESPVKFTDRKGKSATRYDKADIFRVRMNKPLAPPDKAANVADALTASLVWMGYPNAGYMALLLGRPEAAVRQEAIESELVFDDPASGRLVIRDSYLSGYVQGKLDEAREAAKEDPAYRRNVAALEAALPERKGIANIGVSMNSPWLPPEVMAEFLTSLGLEGGSVSYRPEANHWSVFGNGDSDQFSTANVTTVELIQHALEMTLPRVSNWEGRGTERKLVFDPAATQIAKATLDRLKQEFQRWAKTSDAQVSGRNVQEVIVDAFNEKANGHKPPQFEGAYITLPGASEEVFRSAIRRSAIARMLDQGSGMIAHGVGFGKTYTLIALAMEMKRLGKANRPMIIVENATLSQFSAAFRTAYPNANLLVADEKSFAGAKRRGFVARIATGDYDCIVMPHSSFNLIPNHKDVVNNYINEQVAELTAARALTDSSDKRAVAALEKAKIGLENSRKKILDSLATRQDLGLTWEDLGVDALLVDEAHRYKNAPVITRMQGMKNIPTGEPSQRAVGMVLKTKGIQDRMGGRGVFFATGTPVSNSMAEAYVMLRYTDPHLLAQQGVENFDQFVAMFGESETKAEANWKGAISMETRLSKFMNGNALINLIRSSWDVQMDPDVAGINRPEVSGGGSEPVMIAPGEANAAYNNWVINTIAAQWESKEFWDNLGGKKQAFEDHPWMSAVPIMTMQAGIAAALDIRLVDPNAADYAGSKVNTAVRDILKNYKETQGYLGTQAVFADLRESFSIDNLLHFAGDPGLSEKGMEMPEAPPSAVDAEGNEIPGPKPKKKKKEFDLYQDIAAKLVAGGIPRGEIGLLTSAMSAEKRTELFDRVNSGEIRVVVGSTDLMGVGVNMQERLFAVHHLMPPRDFKPASMEQRNGRILRQGNLHYDMQVSAFVEAAEKATGKSFRKDKGGRQVPDLKAAREALEPDSPDMQAADEAAAKFHIRIREYAMEKSIDSAIYSMMAAKQRMVVQLLMGEVSDFFEDPSDAISMGMAEIAARAIGDPTLIRRVELEREIRNLTMEFQGFQNDLMGARTDLRNTEHSLAEGKGNLERLQHFADVVGKIGTDKERETVWEFGGQTIDRNKPKDAEKGWKAPRLIESLDLHLLDESAKLANSDRKMSKVPLVVDGVRFTVEIHQSLGDTRTEKEKYDDAMAGNPDKASVKGAVYWDESVTKNSNGMGFDYYSGAQSLIQSISAIARRARNAPKEFEDGLEYHKKRLPGLQFKASQVFVKSEELAALQTEMDEVTQRLAANAAPRPVPVDTPTQAAAKKGIELPAVTPVNERFMTPEVRDIIGRSTIEGAALTLPEALDRKAYERVNKALESAGGRWDRSTKTHLFAADPSAALGLAAAPAPATPETAAMVLSILRQETPANYPGRGLAPRETSLMSSPSPAAVRAYLDGTGMPANAVPGEHERISRTLAQIESGRVAERGPDYSQGDLFGGDGPVAAAGDIGRQVATLGAAAAARAKARTGLGAVSPDLIAGMSGDWEALARVVNAKGRASSILPDLVNREIPAWSLVGTKIETPADVHALMLPLRSPYFESLKIMVVDGNNNIIHSQIMTVGSVAESVAHPADMFGMLARLRESTGKKHANIIISHNHPSGEPSPSGADERITRVLQQVADLTGWNLVDHVITNGETYFSFREAGLVRSADKAEKAYAPRLDGAARPKSITPEQRKAGWEVVSRGALKRIDNPDLVSQVAKALRQGNPDAVHVIYANTRLNLTAVERIDVATASNRRKLGQVLLSGRGREGAYSFFLDLPASMTIRDIEHVTLMAREIGNLTSFKMADSSSIRGDGSIWSYANDGSSFHEEPSAAPDFFAAATAPGAAQALGQVKAGNMNALGAYRTLTAKREKLGRLSPLEEDQLLQAEQALGQKLAFDMEALRGEARPKKVVGYSQRRPEFGNGPLGDGQREMFQTENTRGTEKSGQMSLLSSPSPEADAVQAALANMPPIFGAVFAAVSGGATAAEVMKRFNLTDRAVTNILDAVRSRIATATTAAGANGLQPAMRNGLIDGGRPDLALGALHAVAAVDQTRNDSDIPGVRGWDEVTAQAESNLAKDYAGEYSRLLAKAGRSEQMTDVEVATAKRIIAKETLRGRIKEPADRVKLAMLIHGYRDVGTETARALAIRRDPLMTPAERHAQFIAEALFSPDSETRARLKKAKTGDHAEILAGWMKRVDAIKAELLAQGIDLDAALAAYQETKQAREAAEQDSPRTKQVIEDTIRKLGIREKAVVNAIREGALLTKAALLAGVSNDRAADIWRKFVADFRANLIASATRFMTASLAASPTGMMAEIEAMFGIYDLEMIDDRQAGFVDRRNEKPRKPRKPRAPTPTDTATPADGQPAPEVPGLTPEQQAALDEAWERFKASPLSDWGTLFETEAKNLAPMVGQVGFEEWKGKARDAWQARQPDLQLEPISDTAGDWAEDRPFGGQGELIRPPVNGTQGTFDMHDPVAVKRVMDAFAIARGGKMDALMEFWRMSILSGPQTHVVNTGSNVLNAAYNLLPRRAVEAGINNALSIVGLGSREQATFGEFSAMAKNLREAAALAGRNMIRSWNMDGARVFESYATAAAGQLDFSGVGSEYIPSALGGRLGKVMRSISFRAMAAADEFIKSFYGQLEAAAQAHRIARVEEKLTGDAYGKRVTALMEPGSQAWVRAFDEAKRITFQTDIDGTNPRAIARLDQVAELAIKGRNLPWLGRPATFFLPFIHTPLNIFKQAVEMSPLGGALAVIDGARSLKRRIVRGDLTKAEATAAAEALYNRARFVTDLTNQTIGFAVYFALQALVTPPDDDPEALPVITGTVPYQTTRRGERDNAYAVMPPMTIRLGDVQLSYSRVEPFATVMAGMVDLLVSIHRHGGMQPAVVSEWLSRFKDQAKDKTFLQGVSNLLNAVEDPSRFGERITAGIVTGFVPNLIRQPVRELNSQIRDTSPQAGDGFFTSLAKRVGYSVVPQSAPAKLDVWGNEIDANRGQQIGTRATDLAFRILDPTNLQLAPAIDPIDRWIFRYNLDMADSKNRIAIQPLDDSIDIRRPGSKEPLKVPLTPAEHLAANRRAGQAARAMLRGWENRAFTPENAERIMDTFTQVQRQERARIREDKMQELTGGAR